MTWVPVNIDAKLFASVDETCLTTQAAALENGYHTALGTVRRWPGLRLWRALDPSEGRVYLTDWRDDLIAITDRGSVYRLGQDGLTATNVTGVPLQGGGRVIVAKTERELLLAAGGPILTYDGRPTRVLSPDAPLSTHVAFISGYVVAIEPRSGRFYHSAVGSYTSWNPLDVFSAEGRSDALTALFITPYGEMLLIGPDSIEQFDAVPNGAQPFARRYVLGDGVRAPYSVCAESSATFLVNRRAEFVTLTGQSMTFKSTAVQSVLEAISDWRDAWATVISYEGARFVLLSAPNAVSPYDTQGVTLLYAIGRDEWASLYAFDPITGLPTAWPGWSYCLLGGRHYVGGANGQIYEMTSATYAYGDAPQRFLLRTGHEDTGRSVRVDDVEVRLKRGLGAQSAPPPLLTFRTRKDNRLWSLPRHLSLGERGEASMSRNFGASGTGRTHQWELTCTDDVPIEIVSMQRRVAPVKT